MTPNKAASPNPAGNQERALENQNTDGFSTPHFSTNGTASANGNGRSATTSRPHILPEEHQMHALAAMGMGEPQPGLMPEQFTGIRYDFYRHLQDGEDLADFRPWDPEVADLVRKLVGGDHDEPPQLRYPLVNPSEFRQRPPLTWRIGDNENRQAARILPCDCLVMIYGPSGEGKTFTALDMGLCCHAGASWHGHDTIQCDVLYICAEGSPGLGERLDAWESLNGIPINDDHFKIIEVPVQFFDNGANNTHDLVKELAIAGFMPGLVFVDTLARCTVGARENGTEDTGAVILNMDTVVRALRAVHGSVVVVHHANKQGEMRGSTNYTASIDTIIEVTKPHKSDTLKVRSEKSKHGREFDEIFLDLVEVEDGAALQAGNAPKGRVVSDLWIRILRFTHEARAGGGPTYANLKKHFTEVEPLDKDKALVPVATFNKAMSDLWGDNKEQGKYLHNPSKGKNGSRYHVTDEGMAMLQQSEG